MVLEVDGRVAGEVAPGAHVDVRRADLPGLLVRTGPESFYDDLRSQLLAN
jgi:NAD kinase